MVATRMAMATCRTFVDKGIVVVVACAFFEVDPAVAGSCLDFVALLSTDLVLMLLLLFFMFRLNRSVTDSPFKASARRLVVKSDAGAGSGIVVEEVEFDDEDVVDCDEEDIHEGRNDGDGDGDDDELLLFFLLLLLSPPFNASARDSGRRCHSCKMRVSSHR